MDHLLGRVQVRWESQGVCFQKCFDEWVGWKDAALARQGSLERVGEEEF